MPPRLTGGVEYFDRARADGDHDAVGEGDPLIAVLHEQLVAGGPVLPFVPAPLGMNLVGDLRWQAVGKTFHGTPRGETGPCS